MTSRTPNIIADTALFFTADIKDSRIGGCLDNTTSSGGIAL
ncbi:hypothetical protein [Moraxella lacunata]